ncbi:NAD-dependent epimerase/dehydratase family protein [Acetobacter lambici]|uniref:Polysaccharide biosynthesis protein n=1 Tax=Acetobacter lambici TaxID=1332824 RepID=A0ABT1F2H3_9PROT|nr:nucleoside-diphosphate sugar epimerase/dehydratase [Acetobacter lambici]MCP1243096.1 polysaccharide biosynthesis protein [Acetobacter lambici]MCP1259186.1 polysaccharide biosynthesis protein [Acetobacter lambici]NHO56113.1 NAD-dependent epimerase/dehydratase family protein [Acetobacter lambici]
MVSQRSQLQYHYSRFWPLNRIALNILLDGALAALAALLARWLAAPHAGLLHGLWFAVGGGFSLVVSGLPFRLPQQYWRFSGVSDLLGLAGASVVSALLLSVGLVWAGSPLPSIAFPFIDALVLLVLLGGVRVSHRLAHRTDTRQPDGQRVLLVGADAAADLFLRALERSNALEIRIAGLVGLGEQQTGQRIRNVPILGQIEEIVPVLERLRNMAQLPEALVVTNTTFRGGTLSRVLDVAAEYGVAVLRTPTMTDMSPADQVHLRPIQPEDLLNRPQVQLDHAGMHHLINQRTVLVTGVGGTIGSELVRQIARHAPACLILLDHGEFALWQIDLELAECAPAIPRRVVVADVRDEARVNAIMAQYRPELVFHAAALKHVPIVEANPAEGVLTNVHGTRVVADAAARHGAAAMVVISTDKAVNPFNLMGATKRAAEMYCQALDIQARSSGQSGGMRCITVRFGNVLGSTGSVVPLFQRQLARGGPLTVTHPEMRRYFMTVPEAVGLVLQACVRGTSCAVGTEMDTLLRHGGIFVLDMGEPVKIVDLARQMVRLAGLKPDEDVAIHFTGLRAGEKLYEELFHGRECSVPTDSPGLFMATPRVVELAEVRAAVDQITAHARQGDVHAVLQTLCQLVPEFDHNPNGDVRALAPAGAKSSGAVKNGQIKADGTEQMAP